MARTFSRLQSTLNPSPLGEGSSENTPSQLRVERGERRPLRRDRTDGLDRFFLLLGDPATRAAVAAPRLQRAIGVIYRPDTERMSHYFRARLPDQFDVVLHIDRTQAVEPLEPWSVDEADLPETYPTAL